eukprot:gene17808-22523_t
MAVEMWREMEASGPTPNMFTYNTAIRVFAGEGRLPEALQVLESVRRRALKPDRYTLTTLLLACGRSANSGKCSEQ